MEPKTNLSKLVADNNPNKDLYTKFAACEVTIHDNYPDPDPILSYDGLPIAIKGEISSIVGKAKSRKSFFNTLLMKQLVNPDESWKSKLKGKIIYIDTEQKASRVQWMLRRLEHMKVDTTKHLFRAARALDTTQKMLLVEKILKDNIDAEYIVIDNLRDFLPSGDINNQTDATEVVNRFVQLADFYDVHISLVLHTNPTAEPGAKPKPSGAVGSKLLQACSSIIYVEKTDMLSSIIHPMEMRDGDFEPFKMTIEMENHLSIPTFVGADEDTQRVAEDKANFHLAKTHYNDKAKMAFTLKTILDANTDLKTTALAEAINTEFKRLYNGSTPAAASAIAKDIPAILCFKWRLIWQKGQRDPWKFDTSSIVEDKEEKLPF